MSLPINIRAHTALAHSFLDTDSPLSPSSDLTALSDTPSPLSDDSGLSSPPSSILFTPTAAQGQSPLLRNPSEIIHRVLATSGYEDLPALAQAAKTCRELRSFIYENPDQALWRDIHLRRFDDPREAGAFVQPRKEYDWKKRVQDREFVARIFREWGEDRYEELPEHLDLIATVLHDLYLDLPALPESEGDTPTNPDFPSPPNSVLLESILRSPTWDHITYHLSTRDTRPLLRPLRDQPGNPNRRTHRESISPILSKLHALLSPDFRLEDIDHRRHRGFMREVVYGTQNYWEGNDYGPFTTGGKVDWRLVDAVASVMMSNAKDVLAMGEDGWRCSVLPRSFGLDPVRGLGFRDIRRPVVLEKDEVWDWAGVQGTWCGSYAFLDYSDWISLNEPRLVQLRRSAHQLDLTRYNEAIGDLMRLELEITKDPSAPRDPTLSPRAVQFQHLAQTLPKITTNLPTSDLLPPIYFHGSSQQSAGASTYASSAPASFVRGVVQLTADDPPEVRWTLVIRYGGEDRWRLECVQVGGRGSKRGFFGIWTDAMKEEHTPNGPIWYWKP